MDFMTLAKKRYSVRKYTDQPVEKEKLDVLLEAARIAPTGANKQPQKIYVLQSDEALAKLSSLSKCVFGAKTVMLFAYDMDEDWKNPLEEGVHAGVASGAGEPRVRKRTTRSFLGRLNAASTFEFGK